MLWITKGEPRVNRGCTTSSARVSLPRETPGTVVPDTLAPKHSVQRGVI
jgi:hypothetical protein